MTAAADAERLALLRATHLLDGADAHPAFDALVRMASALTGSAVALINLAAGDTMWAVARVGTTLRQYALGDSLCGRVVAAQEALSVADLPQDARFADLLARTGPAPWRSYLGVPLIVEGQVMGSVCVMDLPARQWTEADHTHMRDVSASAAALVEAELGRQRARRNEARVRTASLAGSDWLWETDADGRLQWVSTSLLQHTGLDPTSEVGVRGADLYVPHPAHLAAWDRFVAARAHHEPFHDMIGVRDTPRGRLVVSVSGIPVFDSHGTFKGYRGASRNITRQVEAEDAARQLDLQQRRELAASQARLSAVLHALPDIWFLVDAQGTCLDGHGGHPLMQARIEQLIGHPLGADVPADIGAMQQRAVARALQTGSMQHLEYGLDDPDGVRRHYEARVVPMPGAQALFIARDLSERQQALDKLRVSETLYRTVAGAISDGLLITEAQGQVVALNPAACRILGVDAAALRQVDDRSLAGLSLMGEDGHTPLLGDAHPVMAATLTGQSQHDRCCALVRPDGRRVWVNLSCHPLRTEAATAPFAFMTRLRDVTQERETLMALARSEERWKFALEGAGDGVWDWDLATGQVYFSSRWKHLLGYEDDEVDSSAEAFFLRVHAEDRERVAASLMAYIGEGCGEHQIEFRMLHRDGRVLQVLSRGKVMQRNAEGMPTRVVGTHSDVTLVREAERTLVAKQMAEAANAAKTAFLSRMSHEIRTPLNAIHGFAQLLRLQPAVQHGAFAGVKDHIDQILHASEHLCALINEVLDLQQVEAGQMRFSLAPVALQPEVARMLTLLTPMATRHGVQLHATVPEAAVVLADRQRLNQVLMNLLSNAIKYNRPGGRVEVSVLQDGPAARLSIRDTGQGMSSEQLARLFQPFERLGRETSDVEGTGLGLIITRSLVEAMGGSLSIDSRPDHGTLASLTLPCAVGDADLAVVEVDMHPGTSLAVSVEPMPPVSPSAPARALNVLYVEDNRINAMLFEEALRPFAELNLSIAEDGDMAVEMAQQASPDVLVLDAHLPGMSGFDVLRVLRTLPGLEHVPAYMCSADAMPEDIERALSCGFRGYWTKPIDIVAVTTELRRLAAAMDNGEP